LIEFMSRPRILHIHSTFDAGGAQVRVCRMINHWGDTVEHLISAHDGHYGARDLILESASVKYATDIPYKNLWALGKYLRALHVDLICCYNWGAMDVLLANRLFAQRPLVQHEEGFGQEEAVRQNPKRVLYRRLAYPGASKIVAVSKNMQRICDDVWKQPKSRVAYIPNGIDVDAFAAGPVANAIPGFVRQPGEIIIGTVARINEIKNIPLLVEAVAKLRQSHAARLIIIGEGPHSAAVHAAAQAHTMVDALIMPGFLPNPQNYVGHFDIFALTSNSEQFPISLVEAMAAGLPCATTNAGDCHDMLCDDNKAFVTPIGDTMAFAASLHRLALDADLRKTLGMANRETARRRFSFDAMMRSYAHLYATVAGRPFPA
jgi:L-malate glycosyltransferase